MSQCTYCVFLDCGRKPEYQEGTAPHRVTRVWKIKKKICSSKMSFFSTVIVAVSYRFPLCHETFCHSSSGCHLGLFQRYRISFWSETSAPRLVLIRNTAQTREDKGCSIWIWRFISKTDFWCFLLILKAFVTCGGVTLTLIHGDKADTMKEWRREPVCFPFKPNLTNAKFTRNGFRW